MWLPEACVKDDCESPVRSRGMCGVHYQRWLRAQPKRTPLTTEERFWSHVEIHVDGCWLCDVGINAKGYSSFSIGGRDGQLVLSHRYAFELAYGPIPDGLVLDHLCRNPPCVRPDHVAEVNG